MSSRFPLIRRKGYLSGHPTPFTASGSLLSQGTKPRGFASGPLPNTKDNPLRAAHTFTSLPIFFWAAHYPCAPQ